jgi:MFS family permease
VRTVWFMAISTGLVVANIYYAQPLVARLADRHGPRTTLGIALALISLVWLGVLGQTMPGPIIGVTLLDLGGQSGHVSNRARIYSIAPEAHSHLNTVYMVS